jgi:hypothetical protein
MKRYVSAVRARKLRRKGVDVIREAVGKGHTHHWVGAPCKASAQAIVHIGGIPTDTF